MMTEFESRLLEMTAEQNNAIKRIEAAVSELGATVESLNRSLLDKGRPNVVQLGRRVTAVEGELSELGGKVVAIDAELQRAAR